MLRSKMSPPQPMPCNSVTLRISCQVTTTRRSTSLWGNGASSGAPSRGSLERRRRNWQLGSDRWQLHATFQPSRIHWTRAMQTCFICAINNEAILISPCSVRRKSSWCSRRPYKSRRKWKKQPIQPKPRSTQGQMRSRWSIRRSPSETTTTTTRSHHHLPNYHLAPLPGDTVVERTAMRWRTIVCLTQFATFVARKDTSNQPVSPSRGHLRSTSSQRLPSTI